MVQCQRPRRRIAAQSRRSGQVSDTVRDKPGVTPHSLKVPGMKPLCLLALTAGFLGLTLTPATAACTIASSPCYPWRIEAGQTDTVLLEIVPSNAATSALYRVCLCPPTGAVSLVFDFEGQKVPLGTLERGSTETICRDWRIQTARKSRLLLRRVGGDSGAVEGCYTTQ